MLAAVSGALGRYLRARGHSTKDLALRAMVPISVRAEDEHGALGNRVSAMMAPLPVWCEDPIERLRLVTTTMGDLKSSKQAVGASLLTEVTDFAPPTIAAQAARLQSRQRFFNLVVTNVPGPQFPLYLLGRELQDVFPMVPLAKNQGVCFALMSYNGRVNFGLTADYDAMPDLDQLADDLEASIAELAAAAPGGRRRSPAAASGGSKRQPSTRSKRRSVSADRSRPTLRRCSRPMRIGAAFIRWEHRYGWVLLLILCSLVFQLAVPDQDWARVVTIALQGGALVLALYASQARPLIARLTILVVTLAVLGSAAALVGFGEFGTTAGWIVAALLVALAPLVIVRGVIRGVRTEGSVTISTMFGVLCIYLLLGMLFAFAYGLVGDVQSEPFFASGIDPDISDYLYFSFATMTTVGYGDLVAGTDLGRSVAITEALIGQIYLVTVVAVIVGNLSRRRA